MKNSTFNVFTGAVVLLVCLIGEASGQTPGEWPQWRGPNRDGISKETGLLKQWPAQGPPLVWKMAGAGRGYSSMAISNGRLFTMGLRGDREFVIAFDTATGKQAWATPNGNAFRNDRGDGPRGTPTVDGDKVYSLGGEGDLSCIEAGTGRRFDRSTQQKGWLFDLEEPERHGGVLIGCCSGGWRRKSSRVLYVASRCGT